MKTVDGCEDDIWMFCARSSGSVNEINQVHERVISIYEQYIVTDRRIVYIVRCSEAQGNGIHAAQCNATRYDTLYNILYNVKYVIIYRNNRIVCNVLY